MTDIVNKATRSRMMSGIRATNTQPELRVRSLLHRGGFRFRLHVRQLPGKPDIVLQRYRAVVFVHGCFWHGHDCLLFKMPSTRRAFWRAKLQRNRENDLRAAAALSADDWRVGTVWECAMRGRQKLDDATLARSLARWLRSSIRDFELVASRGGK